MFNTYIKYYKLFMYNIIESFCTYESFSRNSVIYLIGDPGITLNFPILIPNDDRLPFV